MNDDEYRDYRAEADDLIKRLASDNYQIPKDVEDEVDAIQERLFELSKKHDFPVVSIVGFSADDDTHGVSVVRSGRVERMSLSQWLASSMVDRNTADDMPLHVTLLMLAVVAALKETESENIADAVLKSVSPIIDAYKMAQKLGDRLWNKTTDLEGDIGKDATDTIALFRKAFNEEIEKGWKDENSESDPEDS